MQATPAPRLPAPTGLLALIRHKPWPQAAAMRLFNFVGGAAAGAEAAFARRLTELGGPPAGWRVLPHADGKGLALHLVEAEDESAIDRHLEHFGAAYARGPIVEVVARTAR